MAGPNLTTHTWMNSVQSLANSIPLTQALPEKSGQTFYTGIPVQLNAGYVQKWDGATITAGILGISLQPASNLATNGAGSPGSYGQVGPPGAIQTYGTVPNEPSAVNIAIGAPMTDGRTLFEVANRLTVFEAQFDNSAGSVAADYTPTQTMIGSQFGITFDANGQAYVDNGKTTAGTNTVCVMVGINPIDMVQAGTANTYIVNARVRFQFLSTAIQIFS